MPAMRTAVRPAVILLAGVGILAAITTIAQQYGFSILAVDQAAVRDGLYAYRSPLTNVGTALPPPALFLVSPATWLPLAVAGWLTALAGVAALGLALVALVGPIARRYGRRRWPVVLAAGALALTVEPARAALGLGTLDLIVFGLVTADIVALRRSARARSRAAWWPGRPAASTPRRRTAVDLLRRGWATGAWAGLGVGLGTALSGTPAFFIVYLALTRQWRAALTATGTALTALLITPHATATWFTDVLWRIDRTGPVDATGNQSLAGVLARIYDSDTTPVLLWLSFALLVIAVGFIRARAAHTDGDEIAAFTLIGLTAAIVGPVTDTHETIWILPALLILTDAAARRRARSRLIFATAAALTYLLFVLAPMWSLHDPIATNSYAVALILLVNALPWRPGAAPAFPVNRWLGRSPAAPRARTTPTGPTRGAPRPAQSPKNARPPGPTRPATTTRTGIPHPTATIPPPRTPDH